MKKTFTLIILFLLTARVFSQISEDGQPVSFATQCKNLPSPVFVSMTAVDLEKLQKEDLITDQYKQIPWRFGENINVDLRPDNSGRLTTMENGDKIWQLGITSKNALSINLTFGRYRLPVGAKLFIYTPDKKYILGAFTQFNNQRDGVFATTLVPGDSIIVEYYEPSYCTFAGELQINRVTHGYRSAFDYAKNLGSSGSCNNNVACATGWDNEIRSVCMLVVGGSAFCSGSLINNTAQDGKPYILTANHCSQSNDFTSWVFWFNWQSSTCTNPSTSPPYNSISGSTLRARNSASDFCLVEMTSPPTSDFYAFYEGWDHSGTQPLNQTCIHHPAGDIKKITYDYDPATAVNWGSPSATCWEIGAWNSGTTEGGSSGSPLFDQNHHVIGQLYGGQASCTQPTQSDNFGRFAVSFDFGTTAATRLKDWLDPINSGDSIFNGHDFNVAVYTTDASLYSILSPDTGIFCQTNITPSVSIRNYGSDTLRNLRIYYSLDGAAPSYFDWTGAIRFLSSATVNLPQINAPEGNHSLTIFISSPNGGIDQNLSNDTLRTSFNLVNGTEVSLYLLTDPYPEQTTWRIYNSNHTVVYSNPALTATNGTTQNFCLPDGCYDFVIYDSGGNGLNGYLGFLYPGSFNLSYNGTAILQASGNFGSKDSVRFCTDQLHGIDKRNDLQAAIYPNPNFGTFTVELMENERNSTCTICSIFGGKVYSQKLTEQHNTINLPQLTEGVYIVEIKTETKTLNKKLYILKN